ncbi:MAG: pseudaminic acid synthase [Bacteroidota bacterium]
MNDKIQLGQRTISKQHRPFIIAEMSGNHNQSLERALAIVDAAAAAGADAIKLQTYTADTMTINARHGLFNIDDQDSLWKGHNLYQLYQIAHTPWKWHEAIFARAKSHGMLAFSSPFDASAVDFLESLEVPLYKIASFENTDHPLLKKIAQTGKPVIMSTGLTQLSELDESVRVLRENGCQQLVLLKCTSTYPASPEHSNIRTISHMQQLFDDVLIGLSDHTMGIGVPVAAVALGACVIEKHFTLSRADGGVDSAFSLEPEELRALVVETKRAFQALGKVQYGVQAVERDNKRFKRSVYVVKDIQAGETFDQSNLRIIRPGDGLAPKYFEGLIGKKAKVEVKAGTPLSWECL